MLEDARANVDEITSAVGYGDTRSFSRLFKRETGLAPRQYRDRFGVVARR
jgi:transcriptional regulator GlxA family with amidase domain